MVDEPNLPANPPPGPVLPRCPHCQKEPTLLSAHGPILLGTVKAVVLFCGNPECRMIFNVHIIAIEGPKIVSPFQKN